MKVGVFRSEPLKFFAIVNIPFGAGAKEQPELALLMAIGLGQQPVQHGAEGGDPGPGGNKHGVAQWRPQNEIAKWALERNLRAFAQIAEIIRHESIRNAIQTKTNSSIVGWSRSDRISACNLLASRSLGFHREPLSGKKAEASHSIHFEFDVFCKFG